MVKHTENGRIRKHIIINGKLIENQYNVFFPARAWLAQSKKQNPQMNAHVYFAPPISFVGQNLRLAPGSPALEKKPASQKKNVENSVPPVLLSVPLCSDLEKHHFSFHWKKINILSLELTDLGFQT